MVFKGFIVVISATFLQMIASQSIGNIYNPNFGNAMAANAAEAITANGLAYGPYSPGYGYPGNMYPGPYPNPLAYGPAGPCEVEVPIMTGIPGLTYGLTLADLSASRGCGMRVMSSSPIAPTGITVQSDNMAVEGPLSVSGQLPFLGVVSVEGPLAALGAGAVAYGCGNGNVGMVSEGLNEPAALANPTRNGYPNPGLGLAPGLAPGVGCNGLPGAY